MAPCPLAEILELSAPLAEILEFLGGHSSSAGKSVISPATSSRLPGVYMVGLGGVEPPTSPLSGVRSNQLSYRPGGRRRAA